MQKVYTKIESIVGNVVTLKEKALLKMRALQRKKAPMFRRKKAPAKADTRRCISMQVPSGS